VAAASPRRSGAGRPIAVNVLAAFTAIGLLTACAAGAPTVASNPTPSAAPTKAALVATAVPSAPASAAPATPPVGVTSTSKATGAVGAKPTRTPKPKHTPTPEPTERPAPPPDNGSGLSQVFDHGTSGRREVGLTFDAGADRGYAEQILDTLAAEGVKASFGITGHWAEQNPDLVKRMVAEGHMVFNHTYDHSSFTGYSTGTEPLDHDQRIAELTRTERIIRKLTGGYEVAPYFRPPYADYDDSVLADVDEAGYWITVQYDCDTLGWNGATVDQIVERCGDNASPGDIILMHVGSASLDAKALPRLIDALRAKDLAFVTVEQLLQD
jgi:peptidoglycan-N-acetylglucosamine deacetylase